MNATVDRLGRTGCAVVLGAVLAAGAAGCGGGDAEPRPRGADPDPDTATVTAAPGTAALERQFEQVIQKVLPSVVQIDTGTAEGSGVVYDRGGHIVTNAHVVAGADRIRVVPASGGRPLEARLVGAFAADDLAVVRVSGGTLPPARFGDSTKLRVGQLVLAMGNPLGLSGSVTNGIVSATGRSVTTGREGDFPGATIADAIQTSAAINPGNSGGALVTLDGEVIGIPTAAANDPRGGAAPGIGFATPSATVRGIVPQLIRDGRVTNSGRAALGVTVRTVVDLDSGEPAGVEVVGVSRGQGAEKAGIRAGDVIVAVNGTPTPTQAALSQVLAALKPGQVAKVELLRGDSRTTVNVTLGQLPGG
ncbi:MAG TPA: trypsin-like peptidase domain-containing protein [Thermomonospora sp.]|nr:trypsin-like peptidase domain-containing protein [Thermomonospora sp.]